MGRPSPGPTRWPPGAERRLVPAKSNLKPQTTRMGGGVRHQRQRHDGVREERGGPGERHHPQPPGLPQLEMGPPTHLPAATERTPPVVPGADGKVGHSYSSPTRASISSHTADYPTPHPLHRRCRQISPRRTTRTHLPRRNVIGTPPQPPPNAPRTDSPSVTSPTTTMPPATCEDAAHCHCSGHHPRAPSGLGKSSPAPRH